MNAALSVASAIGAGDRKNPINLLVGGDASYFKGPVTISLLVRFFFLRPFAPPRAAPRARACGARAARALAP